MKKIERIFLPIIFIVLIISGCNSSENKDTVSSGSFKENSMIIEVDEKDLVKVSEEQVLEYFNQNKSGFIALANYTLENESEFESRPVIINVNYNLDNIQDQRIKKITQSFFQQGIIKNISSLNDEIKNVNFSIDREYGVFEQGIRYVSDRKIIDEDKTKYNYVKRYEDLGDGWFYYIYHFNKIKDEESFREIAWSKLSEEEKRTIVTESDKAIVLLEDGENIGYKLDKKKRKVVVSVTYNTELDGLLGPITMYFDPSTKELIGYNLRF